MDRYISKAASFSGRFAQTLVERSKEAAVPGYSYDHSEDKVSEIKQCLDSKFDKEKIEGLKRLIAMISKGRNVSEFFPDVVKNVAASSIDVRKLVYIYLLRYADKEPDLALLSINTFQKDLGDRNPLIRAMALRVMSSIRVPVIVPIIMLALRKALTDLSPYVRKTAANAIPKCYSLDASQKDQLVEVITQLLTDSSTVVLGSVLSSFNQVCPERLDLLHKHFRKLCRLLIDTDDWGQIEVIGVLIRYCRTQFLNPNREEVPSSDTNAANAKKDRGFYSDDEEDESLKKTTTKHMEASKPLDPDHALFLRACATLTNSRNPSVVMMVAQAYMALAPRSDLTRISKSLIRILRVAQREQKYVILSNIASLSHTHPDLFRPFFKTFFVYASDPVFIRNLKLEVLASLANEATSSSIMREFKDYVRSPEKDLVVRTIQVMGRIAAAIPSLADESLAVLMALISSKNEDVVSEAVVVTRRLLQLRPTHESSTQAITQLARAMDLISTSAARASILWLVGQYCSQIPLVAPDTLRKAAKSFPSESESVKLQVLNLAAKLTCTAKTDEVVKLLLNYVLELARFDVSFDVRDRARFLKALVCDLPADSEIGKNVVEVVLGAKGHPVSESPYQNNERFTIGTLSHSLGVAAKEYTNLPPWPTVQPDPSVRDVVDEGWSRDRVVGSPEKDFRKSRKVQPSALSLDAFYDEQASSSSEESEDEDEDDEEEDDDEEEEDDDEEEDEEEDDEESEDNETKH
ncbi:hypothetical protein SmJEL517_g01328 [Synchytrium microbalum]|uniref:AP complex subunit beta n=1 Tax=Synchytrium microbalum TaxID=1806994 RepID=A0A507CB02_9FUNG|nr:uncharacterized protein SmJEL517_g01328 [Synchytrium microbalum]TPX36641.1 hypothetical protein SmJEL517_g01328 [Synchytrium microbalum]